jgi:tryptophanyl-tRNA synthetase
MLAYKGELEKTTTFKDKVRMQPENVNAGLLTYPVLQAADILIHRALKVPVGKDQEQHLEMARTFGNRFNRIYNNDLFPEPQAFNYGNQLVKVPGLQGGGKMSKSDGDNTVINLNDDDVTIRKKIMIASWGSLNDPQIYSSLKLDISKIEPYLAEKSKETGEKITLTIFIIKLLAIVLKKYPALHAYIKFGRV